MKCPYCNKPMREDQVYCENCGKERQFVPVFEPEIEESIQESLTAIVDTISDKITTKIEDTEQAKTNLDSDLAEQIPNAKKKHSVIKIILIAIFVVALFTFGIVGTVQYKNHNSYDFQIKQAASAFEEGNYIASTEFSNRAIEIAPNSSDAKLLLASAYIKMENLEDAIIVLEKLISNDNAYESAYDELIMIYKEKGRYRDINTLLKKCKEASIIEKYQPYIAFTPEYSVLEGSYDEVVSLKILAAGNGTIYYTINGDEPTIKSDKYTAPLRLETGEYDVSAVFVNQYGVSSDVIKQHYSIDIKGPDVPEISVESGTYVTPAMISAYVPEGYELYYTVDHTEPTQKSQPYIGPLAMPIGNSQFKFIMYDEQGIASEIVTREYQLTLTATIGVEDALAFLKQSLLNKGEIIDMDGHLAGVSAKKEYDCSAAFSQEDQIFYLITEYMVEETTQTKSKSGNIFAINITTGELYRATTNFEGYYVVEAF